MSTEEQTELLREMRDLLRVMAEPALAKRDAELRASLSALVGKSRSKADAVVLMDGSRNQAAIQKQSGMDQGDLSRLVKALRERKLLGPNEKQPKLVIPVPSNFFKGQRASDE